ncbi:putative bifunctional diguanylate cyclase/phosphodiesterase [Kineococcus rhizosphaerae]|uniref:Diguanylate cyclase (GGDEF)-like protein n=1 Tax=Kineococcus rhizosphaerae TaxID=559628 RepID=A0A2T0QXZ8_9ACTN|nr:bifunctional diguanylate cyclase/phosphodiesterase [Kineococcus rhizosphaerae]PRY10824.1 diguanylate cyclase (GGDEF)-like protein [Kineococcus rhizosphaerae]
MSVVARGPRRHPAPGRAGADVDPAARPDPRAAPATRLLLAGAALYGLVCAAAALGLVPAGTGRLADATLGNVVELGVLVALTRRARRSRGSDGYWTLLAVGVGAYCVSEVAFDVAEAVLGRGVRDVTGLELGYVVGYGALLAAAVRLVWVGARRWRVGYVAEALGILLITVALAQEYVVHPLVAGGRPSALVASWVTLVVLDALLLAGSVVVAARSGRAWWLPAAGFGLLTAADTTFTVVSLTGRYAPGSGVDAIAVAGLTLLGVAALRIRTPSAASGRSRLSIVVTPAVVLPTGFGLLVVDHVDRLSGSAVWLTAGACAAALVRLVLSQSELLELATLRREALTDDLTGIANRRALLADLERRCAADAPFALAIVDLDRFKEVNDGLGHAAGDELLRQVVGQLLQAAPEPAVVARLGGDELALVLPGTAGEAAVADVVAVHAAMVRSYVLLGHRVHVAASLGVASFPVDAQRPSDLLRCADIAMYEAKTLGGAVCAFGTGEAGAGRTRPSLTLMTQLRSALGLVEAADADCGQLVVLFQPQLDLARDAVCGAEALVRWDHPELGVLTPAEFLDEAERHGLMGHLTHHVLDRALAAAAGWPTRSGDQRLRLAVNLSATNLLDVDLPARVAGLLHRHGQDPGTLVLEITETVLMSRSPRTRSVLEGLRALGVGLSIDDFGTGYSSLAYLKELPVEEVKLDRSFVADIAHDDRSAAIVASTIWLGHRLGVRIVGEGVETARTLEVLRGLRCDTTQGFLHSRPLVADEFERWLAARRAGVGTAP